MGFYIAMNQTLANVAVVAATVGTIAFLVPQISKLIRTGDSAGVSTTWAALGLVTNVGWFAYMINQSLWVAILAPLITMVAYALTMWALVRTGRDPRKSYLLGVVWGVLLMATALLAGWTTLGVVLGLSYGVMLTPSVWTHFARPTPPESHRGPGGSGSRKPFSGATTDGSTPMSGFSPSPWLVSSDRC